MDIVEYSKAIAELSPDEQTSLADHLRASIAALHRSYLAVIAALDTESNWRADGCTSMGRWVAGRHAMTPSGGAELVSVAHALDGLPAIAAAYSCGELSWDQTRMLARYATPETDDELARHGTRSSVNSLMLEARRHQQAPEPVHADRFADLRPDSQGAGYKLSGWLSAADGEKVLAALNRIAGTYPADPETGVYAPIAQRRADALTELASRGLADDGDSDRACVTVFFDVDRWQAEFGSGIQLGETTFQRLCCDARFEAIGRSNGQVVAAAALKAGVPWWLRRAAKRRDHGCRFPGCGHVRRTEAHHVVPNEHGGPTTMENIVTLCTFHHHLVHEGGWQILGSPNEPIAFVNPHTNRRVDGALPALDNRLRSALAFALSPP